MLIRSARPVLALLLALLLAGCVTSVDGSPAPAESGWTFVGEQPCADTDARGADQFSCVRLSVPVDHAAPDGEHWDVTFGVHRASGERRGVFVTATGGPGSGGLAAADNYSSGFSDAVWRDFDVVFFDQRGIGLSQDLRCDQTYYETFYETVDSTSSATERDAYAAAATTFGTDCFAEAGVDPATAPRYATSQAVEDLEDFREWLGAPGMPPYGESYGTQYVHTYAAAHPDRVDGLLVDGVVDLSTPVQDFAVSAAHAYSDVLAATLQACDTEPACADAAPGGSLAGYDELVTTLAQTPGEATSGYPVDDVTVRAAAAGSVSVPSYRTDLQVALNDATNGDLVALDELGNVGGGPAPDFSDALYYAVECQDYDFVPQGGDGRAVLDDWLARADTEGIDGLRLGSGYYGDLPCLFWPGAAADSDHALPAPVIDPPYPVLVLNADTDPNTPVAGAIDVFRDLAPGAGPDDALVLHRGGPHVIYGWGDTCVDDLVDAFVADGRQPAQRFTICPGAVADPYP